METSTRGFTHLAFVAGAALFLSSGVAYAQHSPTCPGGADYCSESETFQFSGVGCGDMPGYSFDSGWLPDETSEIQVRFRVQLGGLIDEELHAASVTMDSEAYGAWPPAVEVGLAGPEDGGLLQVGYGIEVQAQIRVWFEWEGIEIHETRDIPIPYVSDLADRLRMEGQTLFDPISLGEVQTVRGTTDQFTLFEYDVLGAILSPIDVIVDELDFGGGFRLDLEGYAEAEYRTDEVALSPDGGPLTAASPTENVPAPAGGYGTSLGPITFDPEGTLECEVGLRLIPILYVEIFDYELEWEIPIDISVGLADTRSTVDFDPQEATFGLPEVELDPDVLDFSVHPAGSRASETLIVRNNGDATLYVDLTPLSSAIEMSTDWLQLGRGGFGFVIVSADPGELHGDDAGILLETSDPDAARLTVGLLGTSVEVPPEDGGPGDGGPDADGGPGDPDGGSEGGGDLSGGCGCVTAPGPAGPLRGLATLLL